MSLKTGKVNPLNALDLRKVSFPAFHFHYTLLPKYTPTFHKNIDSWIYTNLNSRYYYIELQYLYKDSKTLEQLGFKVKTGEVVWNENKDKLAVKWFNEFL